MSMKKLLIYGCGYPSIIGLIEHLNEKNDDKWEVIGFIDDSKYGKENEYLGYPIVGDETSIPKFVDEGYYFFNNVASSPDNMEIVANKLAKYDAKMCTLVFPQAPSIDLTRTVVGEGSLISPQVIVGGGASFGKNVIVRQQALVGHDSKIGDYCFIGPSAGVMGKVTVGTKTFIGAKALVRENVTIGKNCMVGMGAVVTKDIPDNTTVVGNPAKPLRKKKKIKKENRSSPKVKVTQ